MNHTIDDTQLIECCLAGDTRSFAALVTRYEVMIRTMIGRMVRNEHDVEDLAHEVFIRAWEKLDQFSNRCRFSTWLGQIALNRARDHLRRQSHWQFADIAEQDWGQMEDQAAPTMDAALQERDLGDALTQALDKLKPNDRRLVTLHYLEGHDYQTIAKMLNCSTGAAKVRCMRARSVLRRELEPLRAAI